MKNNNRLEKSAEISRKPQMLVCREQDGGHLAVQSGPWGSPSGGDRASNCVMSSLSEPEDNPTPRRSN